MKSRFGPVITTAVFTLFLVGCNEPANEHTNANHNANTNVANNNTAMANSNTTANENTNSRRGPTREEYERDKDKYAREAKEAGRKIGAGLNDGWLWTKTRFELASADDLRDSTINVDVADEVVTLSGTVASAAQKTRADSVAKSVEGVKTVKNMLKVAPDTSKASPTPTK